MTHNKYKKYGNLQLFSIVILFGGALLQAAAKYFSVNPINRNDLFKNVFVALIILALATFSGLYQSYLLRKKNATSFSKMTEKLSPDIVRYVDYLKSTYLWRLTIYAIIGIPLVLLTPWMAARRVGNSPTMFIYFGIVGSVMIIVAIPFVIYNLLKE